MGLKKKRKDAAKQNLYKEKTKKHKKGLKQEHDQKNNRRSIINRAFTLPTPDANIPGSGCRLGPQKCGHCPQQDTDRSAIRKRWICRPRVPTAGVV